MRTTIIHCDRCKKNITQDDVRYLRVGYTSDEQKLIRIVIGTNDFEICPECLGELGKFLGLQGDAS